MKRPREEVNGSVEESQKKKLKSDESSSSSNNNGSSSSSNSNGDNNDPIITNHFTILQSIHSQIETLDTNKSKDIVSALKDMQISKEWPILKNKKSSLDQIIAALDKLVGTSKGTGLFAKYKTSLDSDPFVTGLRNIRNSLNLKYVATSYSKDAGIFETALKNDVAAKRRINEETKKSQEVEEELQRKIKENANLRRELDTTRSDLDRTRGDLNQTRHMDQTMSHRDVSFATGPVTNVFKQSTRDKDKLKVGALCSTFRAKVIDDIVLLLNEDKGKSISDEGQQLIFTLLTNLHQPTESVLKEFPSKQEKVKALILKQKDVKLDDKAKDHGLQKVVYPTLIQLFASGAYLPKNEKFLNHFMGVKKSHEDAMKADISTSVTEALKQ